ncbi:MAG: hypothetical protein KGZ57_08880 [Dethiobacter sp.]|nr:hypothetical protein [Dethiobacter sp.]
MSGRRVAKGQKLLIECPEAGHKANNDRRSRGYTTVLMQLKEVKNVRLQDILKPKPPARGPTLGDVFADLLDEPSEAGKSRVVDRKPTDKAVEPPPVKIIRKPI